MNENMPNPETTSRPESPTHSEAPRPRGGRPPYRGSGGGEGYRRPDDDSGEDGGGGRGGYGGRPGPGGPGARGRTGPGGAPQRRRFPRRKVCRFCVDHVHYIDFKNYRLLREFLTERGKIMPRRITGTCAFHQRMLTTAIKRARTMALISFVHR